MIRELFVFIIFMSYCFGEDIYANFNVVAKNSSALAFKSIGVVSEVLVEVGDSVKKGDVLARLDDSKERLGLELAQNELEIAKLAAIHAKGIYNKFKQVKDVTSKQNFEDIEYELNMANLNLTKAKIALNIARQNLDDKKLISPYDAIVSKRTIEVGEGVGGVSQKVFEIFSSSEVRLVLGFDEKFKDVVKVGDMFKFNVSGTQNIGKISLIYPTIDRKNQKIYAEVYTNALIPGAFGEGYIVTK